MDGHTLLRMQRELLNETSSGDFMNDRTSYDYLYAAVIDFNKRTYYLTSTQSITVSSGTSEYNANPDFISVALFDSYNRPFIRHTYGTTVTPIYNKDYAENYLENNTATSSIAASYSITDASQPSRITGTATGTGSSSSGECTLTDSSADFTNVYAGDLIHNTTDGAHGVVVSKTSTTALVTALFEGSGNDWAISDAYIITPQPKYKFVLDPIPSATATLTVPYLQKPNPVYSPYRSYKLPFDFALPIVQFSVFLYKYRDREPNYGDAFYKYYDNFTRRIASELRRGIPEKSGFRVNFSKINARSRSIGGWGGR